MKIFMKPLMGYDLSVASCFKTARDASAAKRLSAFTGGGSLGSYEYAGSDLLNSNLTLLINRLAIFSLS